ncbi:MAG: hypothetical protein AB7O67_22840 [Vicinamibacterales bacterium]
MADPSHPGTARQADGKSRWHEPRLVEYGSIGKLTQSGGATRTESGVPRMKMQCL